MCLRHFVLIHMCHISQPSNLSEDFGATVGQCLERLSFNRVVGGSIPALVNVSLSKTLNPQLLSLDVSTVYEYNMESVFEYLKKRSMNKIYIYIIRLVNQIQLEVTPEGLSH